MRDTLDPVFWSPREFNGVADHAVNATMDMQKSWERVDQSRLEQASASKCNLRLCIGGGLRSSRVAAIGLALYEATQDHEGTTCCPALDRH